MDDLTDAKNGLELDTLDLSNVIGQKPTVSTGHPLNQIRRRLFKKITVGSRLTVSLLFAGVVLLFAGINFLWGRTIIDKAAPTYAAVGPVLTNLGTGQPIRIKIIFELKHPNHRDRVAELDTLIKEKMLLVLPSLAEKDIFNEQGINKSLKDRIKSETESLMKENAIEGVYFSEIILY